MLFNSVEFLLFFPVVLAIYYILPKKIRQLWLLGASYYFYMNWNAVYGLLLFGVTVLSYAGARLVSKYKENLRRKKVFFIGTLCLDLGTLVFFKYMDFLIGNMNRLSCWLVGRELFSFTYDIVLPVGISFYVLQSVGYLIDVYRGTEREEKNFLKYALFISFFPQLVAGPIERSGNLLRQLNESQKLSWENCKSGCYLILWGYFTKMVIADRAAIFVDQVYGQPAEYRGMFLVVATMLFAIQIYCDFYGYSTIARGVALCFGIRLVDNFNAPYLALSVTDFWKRWHISLTGWFRDYLYIPLGGNRKGETRKQINRLTVFGISGLWHGASFAFIAWGLLNALFQTIGDAKRRVATVFNQKFPQWYKQKEHNSFSIRLLKRVLTFVMICITWIFFRTGDLSDALDIMKYLCDMDIAVLFTGQLYNLGINKDFFRVMLGAIAVLFGVDFLKYQKRDVVGILKKQEWWFQIGIVLLLCFMILVFGCYGTEYDAAQFIYFQF